MHVAPQHPASKWSLPVPTCAVTILENKFSSQKMPPNGSFNRSSNGFRATGYRLMRISSLMER
jgi:hypothetical protein